MKKGKVNLWATPMRNTGISIEIRRAGLISSELLFIFSSGGFQEISLRREAVKRPGVIRIA